MEAILSNMMPLHHTNTLRIDVMSGQPQSGIHERITVFCYLMTIRIRKSHKQDHFGYFQFLGHLETS